LKNRLQQEVSLLLKIILIGVLALAETTIEIYQLSLSAN